MPWRDLRYKPLETSITAVQEINEAWRMSDNSFSLTLSSSPERALARQADAVVIGIDGLAAYAFHRGPSGAFIEVPMKAYTVQVSGGGQIGVGCSFGWTWRGVSHAATRVGEVVAGTQFELLAPLEGANLWWQLDGQRQNHVSLTEDVIALILR
jgi:hypothetical protein